VLVIIAAVALPSLSYPLAWFSQNKVPHRFEFELPIAVMCLVGILGIILVHLVKTDRAQLPPSQVDRLVPAVLGVGVISILLSSNAYLSISAWVMLFANVALFYVTSVWFDRRYATPLVWAWLIAATAQAAYGLLQVRGGGYPWATIGNKDWVAAYLGPSLLVGLPLWVESRGRSARMFVLGIASLVILATFVISDSVGAWLGLGVAVLAGVTRLLWTRYRLRALLLLGGVVVLVGVLGTIYSANLHATWVANVRPPIWRGALHMIASSPLIGSGLGTFTYQYQQHRPPDYFNTNVLASITVPEGFKHRRQPTNLTDHAHNEFLEIACETGILGLAIMLWLFGFVIVRGWRGSGEDNTDRWIVLGAWCAMIAMLVHNQFDINLRRPPNQTLLWILMGLVIRFSPRPPPRPEPSVGITFGEERAEPENRRPVLSESDEAAARQSARTIKLVLCGALLLALLWFQVYDRIAANAAWRRALIARGFGPISREQAERAMEQYLICLRHDPYRVDAWYRLAYLCAQFPETDEQAIDYYMQVVQFAPDYAEVNANLAFLFNKRGKPRDAVQYLQRAVELNPYKIEYHRALGELYLDLNLSPDFKAEVLEALRLDPNDPWANSMWDTYFKLDKKEIPTGPPQPKKKLKQRPSARFGL
jgi:O-antigen ligase/cytochrome c-type biogenesis protein CcmH/NrfG